MVTSCLCQRRAFRNSLPKVYYPWPHYTLLWKNDLFLFFMYLSSLSYALFAISIDHHAWTYMYFIGSTRFFRYTCDIITQTAVMVTLPCPAFTPAWLTCSAPELKEPPPPPPFPFFAPALPPVYPPPPPPPPASGLPPPPPKPPHGPKRWATSKFTHIQQNRGT